MTTIALAAGVQGLDTGFRSFERAAGELVGAATTGEGDAVGATADILASRLQVQASAQVIRAADDNLGQLLDLLA